MKYITVNQLVEDLEFETIYNPETEPRKIATSELNRPGIQLAGYFHYFAYERIQIIGKVEHCYINTMYPDIRQQRFNKLLSYNVPCVIVSRDLEIHEELLVAAKKYQRKIVRCSLNTTKLVNVLINYLEDKLAPTITLHGVLMEIYGVGILITGKSGIGKSETAVELIKRGHLLVADDSVEIKAIGHALLVGEAPELIKHMIEVRGIGIMDIKSLFGVGAIKERAEINLIINLEEWDPAKSYDRLGLDDTHREILGIPVNEVVVPVRPARNIALLIEIAARNHRQKAMGYHAAEEFNQRLIKKLSEPEA